MMEGKAGEESSRKKTRPASRSRYILRNLIDILVTCTLPSFADDAMTTTMVGILATSDILFFIVSSWSCVR